MKLTGIVSVSAVLSLMVPFSLAQQSQLLVVQKGDKNLAIYDPGTDTIVTQIPVGGNTGHEVTASPDGKMAFVPIYGGLRRWSARKRWLQYGGHRHRRAKGYRHH